MTSQNSQTTHILLVGQTQRDYVLLAECFPGNRWHLTGAAGARSGLEIIGGNHIDVVISDMFLPDGAWSDLCRNRYAYENYPPVVVASESLDARLWADALSRGAYDVLVKPYSTEEVLYVVRNACLTRFASRERSHTSPCFR
jgi:DNA-binding NtrC family response regulator